MLEILASGRTPQQCWCLRTTSLRATRTEYGISLSAKRTTTTEQTLQHQTKGYFFSPTQAVCDVWLYVIGINRRCNYVFAPAHQLSIVDTQMAQNYGTSRWVQSSGREAMTSSDNSLPIFSIASSPMGR